MARDKARIARRVTFPVRIQDGTGIERVLLASIKAALDALEADVTALEHADAREGVQVLDVDLPTPANGGTFLIDGDFGAAAVDKPVLIGQAADEAIDEAEFGLVMFVARVLSATQMQVSYFAPGAVPRRVRIAYILGT